MLREGIHGLQMPEEDGGAAMVQAITDALHSCVLWNVRCPWPTCMLSLARSRMDIGWPMSPSLQPAQLDLRSIECVQFILPRSECMTEIPVYYPVDADMVRKLASATRHISGLPSNRHGSISISARSTDATNAPIVQCLSSRPLGGLCLRYGQVEHKC
jgi:hypothetical protein